jgi:hypothetical protein
MKTVFCISHCIVLLHWLTENGPFADLFTPLLSWTNLIFMILAKRGAKVREESDPITVSFGGPRTKSASAPGMDLR